MQKYLILCLVGNLAALPVFAAKKSKFEAEIRAKSVPFKLSADTMTYICDPYNAMDGTSAEQSTTIYLDKDKEAHAYESYMFDGKEDKVPLKLRDQSPSGLFRYSNGYIMGTSSANTTFMTDKSGHAVLIETGKEFSKITQVSVYSCKRKD